MDEGIRLEGKVESFEALLGNFAAIHDEGWVEVGPDGISCRTVDFSNTCMAVSRIPRDALTVYEGKGAFPLQLDQMATFFKAASEETMDFSVGTDNVVRLRCGPLTNTFPILAKSRLPNTGFTIRGLLDRVKLQPVETTPKAVKAASKNVKALVGKDNDRVDFIIGDGTLKVGLEDGQTTAFRDIMEVPPGTVGSRTILSWTLLGSLLDALPTDGQATFHFGEDLPLVVLHECESCVVEAALAPRVD